MVEPIQMSDALREALRKRLTKQRFWFKPFETTFICAVITLGMLLFDVKAFFITLVVVPIAASTYRYFEDKKSVYGMPDDLLLNETSRSTAALSTGKAILACLMTFGILAGIMIYLYGTRIFEANSSKIANVLGISVAICKIGSVTAVENLYTDASGKPDYGIRVISVVNNTGGQGKISFTAVLNTSEGTFERKRDVIFEPNQTISLDFDFPEPTVNATGMKYQVNCK